MLNRISEERKNHRSQFSHAFPHNNFYLFHPVRLWGDVMQWGVGSEPLWVMVRRKVLKYRPYLWPHPRFYQRTKCKPFHSCFKGHYLINRAVNTLLIFRKKSQKSIRLFEYHIPCPAGPPFNYLKEYTPPPPRIVTYLRKFSERAIRQSRSLNKHQLHLLSLFSMRI